MKPLAAAIVLSVSLMLALWWSIQPPRYAPTQGSTVEQQRQAQCPGNSQVSGKECVCASGSYWNGALCTGAVQ